MAENSQTVCPFQSRTVSIQTRSITKASQAVILRSTPTGFSSSRARQPILDSKTDQSRTLFRLQYHTLFQEGKALDWSCWRRLSFSFESLQYVSAANSDWYQGYKTH